MKATPDPITSETITKLWQLLSYVSELRLDQVAEVCQTLGCFRSLAKGELLPLSEDGTPTLAIVITGLVATVFTESTRHVYALSLPGDVLGLTGSENQSHRSADLSVLAVEPSTLFLIPKSSIATIILHDKAWLEVSWKITAKTIAFHQVQQFLLAVLDPLERLSEFELLYPTLVRRVPQYLLAHFLGMAPETLSRVRRRRIMRRREKLAQNFISVDE